MNGENEKKYSYPKTQRVDHIDDYHGTKVEDPYEWLEGDIRTSEDVENWVQEQRKFCNSFLEGLPHREGIKEKFSSMCNYERFSAPWKSGKYYLFYRNDGLQNQAAIYVTESIEPNAPIKPLIDPNQFSKEGLDSLQGVSSSSDGKYLAYGISGGFDWKEWKIVEVETGKTLPDVIKWSKNSVPAWTIDGRGFFYSRYSETKSETEYFQGVNKNQKVYYHRIGTPQSEDVLVYHSPLEPDLVYSTSVTEDGRFLIITTFNGTTPNNAIVIKDLTEPYGFPIGLITEYTSKYNFIELCPLIWVIPLNHEKSRKCCHKQKIPSLRFRLLTI